MGMQGGVPMQQSSEGVDPAFLPPGAMYGDAPSLASASTLSQISSVTSLQQMLASGQVDERLLSTLQGFSATGRTPGLPSMTGGLGGPRGMGMGAPTGLRLHAQPLPPQQPQQSFGGYVASSSEGSGGSTSAGSMSRRDTASEQASAQQLCQALAQAETGQAIPQVCNRTSIDTLIMIPLAEKTVSAKMPHFLDREYACWLHRRQ